MKLQAGIREPVSSTPFHECPFSSLTVNKAPYLQAVWFVCFLQTYYILYHCLFMQNWSIKLQMVDLIKMFLFPKINNLDQIVLLYLSAFFFI